MLCSNCPVLYLEEEGFEVSFPSATHSCSIDINLKYVIVPEMVWTQILIVANLSALHLVVMQCEATKLR